MKSADRLDTALKRGADELMNRVEYTLRDKPRALARLRRRYVDFCMLLYRAIGRHIRAGR
jgi:hypothetical protein